VNKIEIRPLDPQRFNALAGYTRSPAAGYFSEELEWYVNEDESLIGVLLLDTVDNDFAAIVLVRDEGGRFRAFDIKCSIPSANEARTWLVGALTWHTGMSVKVFPQGDVRKSVDLFSPVAPMEILNPAFVLLSRERVFHSARSIINEIAPHYLDIDGNYVEQFQTDGFDARLWELYIHAYLTEEQLFVERPKPSPDFIVRKYGQSVAIEATIVGRKADNPRSYFRMDPTTPDAAEVLRLHANEMPMRFGSPLYSKLQKRYWEKEQIAGMPFVLAIADFHDDQSMLWSGTALINYLYGVRHDFRHDESGQLIISPIKIEKHVVGGKEIPSGFFFQPEAENISAVLFSASGTVSKFNRIGRQAGYADPGVVIVRQGTCHDHDPNASLPNFFRYVVDETKQETWAEGISIFHNPRALRPAPRELFPSVAHHRFDDGLIVSDLPDFHPYASVTMNFSIKDANA